MSWSSLLVRKQIVKLDCSLNCIIDTIFTSISVFLQMFNAKQLTEWCLYVIALNFTRFEGLGKELDLVVSENSQFFEKHTRPLQGYLRILESKDKWISLSRRQLHQKAKSCLPHKCTIL